MRKLNDYVFNPIVTNQKGFLCKLRKVSAADLLVNSTAIQVCEDICIEWSEIGLTAQKIIGALEISRTPN